MARRRMGAQSRKTGRRWHIPPPLVHGSEPLEGGDVLMEGSGPESVLLWRALRDVMLWAQTPPGSRDELFTPRSEGGEGNAGSTVSSGSIPELDVLLSLAAKPESLPAESVAEACRAVSQRMEAEGRLATALGFAQAAALALPGNAHTAFQVARIARKRADHARAEVWLRRTIGLARQARDWRMYSLAFRSLGDLYALRGNFPVARRLQIRALRGARRGGMRAEQGHALHDLFTIAVETGSFAEAEEFARQALDAYRPRHERLPHLAHDIAYFWMDRGEFARALSVFEALAPVFRRPIEQLFVTANLARAAAGTRDRASFDRHWNEVWTLLDGRTGPVEGAARALVDLARGAETLELWDRVEQAANPALALATEREEGKVRFAAEALLEAARLRRPASTTEAAAAREAAAGGAGQQLADNLVQALQALTVEAD